MHQSSLQYFIFSEVRILIGHLSSVKILNIEGELHPVLLLPDDLTLIPRQFIPHGKYLVVAIPGRVSYLLKHLKVTHFDHAVSDCIAT